MAKLNGVKIGQHLIIQQREPIADAEIILRKGQARLSIGSIPRHREFRTARFLSVEEVADCFDGLKLIIEVWLEVEFHGCFALQTADGFKAILVKDGGEVRFR